jgi:hydroxymethylbilane synthase
VTWKLGTRGSQLAMWQAKAVAARIEAAGGPTCEIVVVSTAGDRLQQAPLSDIGGKRLFVKELEDALLGGEIDFAVHSAKDMSTAMPDGLGVVAALPREDPRDALVLPAASRATFPADDNAAGVVRALREALGAAPRIGTSSVRRVAQLHRHLPEAEFLPVRGNVDTRLRKLDEGGYDALVLAAAGLRRLDRADRISVALPPDLCVPAPGQGIVAVQCHDDGGEVAEYLASLSDADGLVALEAERALVAALGGGCQLPLGGFCRVHGDELEMVAVVTALDSDAEVRAIAFGTRDEPLELGRRLADRLLQDGADAILDAVRAYDGPTPDV